MEITVNAKIRVCEENAKEIKFLISKLKELNAIDELGGNFLNDISNIFEKEKKS